ncbi:MAG: 2-octaprenyl-6-methoxyphenol hydroxylase [Gammaproteobacteria bacterium]|nr:2-octaprenyl-6-methoxyphenol hydroxylase [Gammaproteobacteria bacterium]
MADTQYDIVIVGGGLIGASLACALKSTGLAIALVEAVSFRSGTQPSYDEKMLSLAPASCRILDGIGAWRAIKSHGVTPIEHIYVSDRGNWGKTRLSASEFGIPALGYVVSARVVGLSLVRRIADTHAAELYCPAKVTAVETDTDGVSVSVDTEGSAVRIRCRLVILADGGTSTTRGMVGIEASAKDYGQTAILCTVTSASPRPGTAFERFTSTGPLAMLPTTGDRYAVVWTAKTDDVERILCCSAEEFLERLQVRFGDWLGQLTSPSRRRPYALKLIQVKHPVGRRALVIGNAAHTIHPVAAQGFNLGLRDVAVLAEVLATHLKHDRDIGRKEVLNNYRDRRRHDIRNTTRFTDALIRIFANERPHMVVGRNIVLNALNHLPDAKSALMKRAMGLNGNLPRLIRGLSLID